MQPRNKEGATDSISGHLRRLGLSGNLSHLSPALAKLVMGGVIPFMKAKGMI